ncbi:hypothetical protein MHB48_10625 [Psychrobacillus sp. FSL H8-0483]|uniref:hypothetical protein n=1 Tax=Psychrobacillus sp. FSL H8-0483 TaxID=2921389 RepID=UPI003159A6C5
MWKKTILFSFSIIVFSILIGCKDTSSVDNQKAIEDNDLLMEEQKEQIGKLKKQNEDLLNELDAQKIDLNYAKEQITYYEQFAEDALLFLRESELLELAKKQWTYSLTVNNQRIPKNGYVEIQDNIMEISLVQKQAPYNPLPFDIYIQGPISGKYEEHIQQLTPPPTETYWTDGTLTTGSHYKYEKIERASTISFFITEELKERLGLDTTLIEIVNK